MEEIASVSQVLTLSAVMDWLVLLMLGLVGCSYLYFWRRLPEERVPASVRWSLLALVCAVLISVSQRYVQLVQFSDRKPAHAWVFDPDRNNLTVSSSRASPTARANEQAYVVLGFTLAKTAVALGAYILFVHGVASLARPKTPHQRAEPNA
jgi:hypothetical protein